mmetsp:Transcript_70513/g.200033  ORF Transcript_70513/g.200033 Transcript_70513/m.200033 type:complete len:882 (-) Transcript_70513:56-2701(-)|eukprot:CAMPEP_0168431650 /NCGR_PEP_ID=MMETSP0228-20121227/38494_1 /TAXON_ID=133427 /ORGANISM="Protoceratium reticulatum, Strain CCCM 535 (=CCMP 1889)" /LENGTH=881 /DNA_ID=CAMNT_0008445771 /DNA_START=54 /DNA_END=2699 /DNA_ORIENTATION=+
MAMRARGLSAVLGALGLATCHGLHFSGKPDDVEEKPDDDDQVPGAGGNCTCLPWSEAFGEGNGMPCSMGFNGIQEEDYCGFVRNLTSGICLRTSWLPLPTEDSEPGCWVSRDCRGAADIGQKYKLKFCKSGEPSTASMSFANITSIAFHHGVDQGILAGFSTTFLDGRISSFNEDKLSEIKATGEPVYIWDRQDPWDDRYLLRGNQVWSLKFSPAEKSNWKVACEEGCEPDDPRPPYEDPEACKCIEWAKLYDQQAGGMQCNGWGGTDADVYCGMATQLRSNACFRTSYASTLPDQPSACFVSPECATGRNWGLKYNMKRCVSSKDTFLAEMPVTERNLIAKASGVDQAFLADFAGVHQDSLVTELHKAQLEDIKASGVPTLIWSPRDPLADRLEVRDKQVWVHTFNPEASTRWEVSCREGCNTTQSNPTWPVSQLQLGSAAARPVPEPQEPTDPCVCVDWMIVFHEPDRSCLKGLGGKADEEFCGFVQNLKTNVCLMSKFMSPSPVQSVCYIKKGCQKAEILVTGEQYDLKACKTGQDLIASELPPWMATTLAKGNAVDVNMMAGFSNVYKDMDPNLLTQEMIQEIKASGVNTYIWPSMNRFSKRLQIKHNEVWAYMYSPGPKSRWKAVCVDNCSMTLKQQKSAFSGPWLHETNREPCTCVPWWLPYWDPDDMTGLDCHDGFGGMEGETFCGLIKTFASNVCLRSKFDSSDDAVAPVCWVQAGCPHARPYTSPHGSFYHLKYCMEGQDFLLNTLPVISSKEIAMANQLDQGLLAGFSTVRLNKLASEVSQSELEKIKDSGRATFIWSERNATAPRLHVRGVEVWLYTRNETLPTKWRVECKEGCKAMGQLAEEAPDFMMQWIKRASELQEILPEVSGDTK